MKRKSYFRTRAATKTELRPTSYLSTRGEQTLIKGRLDHEIKRAGDQEEEGKGTTKSKEAQTFFRLDIFQYNQDGAVWLGHLGKSLACDTIL